MKWSVKVLGLGYALGSRIESNAELGRHLGLADNWFEQRTGIKTRRVCAESENVLDLSAQAVSMACRDAALGLHALGQETILIHIQNGFTHLTPPPGILLAKMLGQRRMRTLSLDGVCAEPINALEIACLMIEHHRCERVIISAGVDFLPMVNPTDLDTIGLFGAGAGALILASGEPSGREGVYSLHWETDVKYWDLGIIPVLGHKRTEVGVEVAFGYYQMRGTELARIALRIVPRVMAEVLREAEWSVANLDCIVTHQPNARFLEAGIRKANLPASIVEAPVKTQGNLGPASLLAALAQAKEGGRVRPGSRVLLLSFGLGFSCGGATLVL